MKPTILSVMLLCMAAPVAAQSNNAQPHCIAVGGSVMTNFVTSDTTLGTVTGDLGGAVSVKLLGVAPGGDGSTVFTVQHHWVTNEGDTIDIREADANATEVTPGLFAIVSYPVKIKGGTGRFAGATGELSSNIGEVDLRSAPGRTVFRYRGQVCFKSPGPTLR